MCSSLSLPFPSKSLLFSSGSSHPPNLISQHQASPSSSIASLLPFLNLNSALFSYHQTFHSRSPPPPPPPPPPSLAMAQLLACQHARGAPLRLLMPPLLLLLLLVILPSPAEAQLRQNYYASTCPNVASIVSAAVQKKFAQTAVTVGATLRLYFHDCFVQGCDASVIIASTPNNTAEKDHPINLSLAGDGFDTVIKAKAAVDAVPGCTNKVSCADILALAARDVIVLAGGPSYAVELGRLDGLRSLASDVNGKLPPPSSNLNQLNSIFAANGLTQTDMIALSAAHSVGFAHCSTFSNRIRNFSPQNPVDPSLSASYAAQLQAACPPNVNPNIAVTLDSVTPKVLDNQYYKNLVNGVGLLSSDEVLFTDQRSQPTVTAWAQNSTAFQQAFVTAMTKMGRIGVKTAGSPQGNIRRNCAVFN